MKTRIDYITYLIICIAMVLVCLMSALKNIAEHNWWSVAIDVACLVVNVICARMAFKKAKAIEEQQETRIQMIYDALPIDKLLVARMVGDIINLAKEQYDKDEMESDK